MNLKKINKILQERFNTELFQNDKKPFNLNILGIRNPEETAGLYDDTFLFAWKYKGLWSTFKFKGTTDPSRYYLENPMNKKGTLILPEGSYPKLWRKGMHKGRYPALVQNVPVKVIRDNDKDGELDFSKGTTDEGLFGLNFHKSANLKPVDAIGKSSAGCQVVQHVDEYEIAWGILEKSFKYWGDVVSYNLINEGWL